MFPQRLGLETTPVPPPTRVNNIGTHTYKNNVTVVASNPHEAALAIAAPFRIDMAKRVGCCGRGMAAAEGVHLERISGSSGRDRRSMVFGRTAPSSSVHNRRVLIAE
jgi:hypothetical protein